MDSVSEQIGVPLPPPGMPGPFELSDRDRLAGILAGAGLEDVDVSEQAVPLRTGSFEEWWSRTTALAGPLVMLLKSLSPEDTAQLQERAREAAKPYATGDGGLEFPGVTLVASGRGANDAPVPTQSMRCGRAEWC